LVKRELMIGAIYCKQGQTDPMTMLEKQGAFHCL